MGQHVKAQREIPPLTHAVLSVFYLVDHGGCADRLPAQSKLIRRRRACTVAVLVSLSCPSFSSHCGAYWLVYRGVEIGARIIEQMWYKVRTFATFLGSGRADAEQAKDICIPAG